MRFFGSVVLAVAATVSLVLAQESTTAPPGTFDKLTGDVVIIHGWGSSRLVDTRKNNTLYWITQDLVDGTVNPPMHLPITNRDSAWDPIVNDGFLESTSYFAYYTPFLNAIQQAAAASNNRFRVHLFDFDFRRNNVDTTNRFIAYLQNLYSTNGCEPVTVISHSMGGIITLAAIHRAPHLIDRVIFAGPPFNGSITALHDKLENSPWGQNTEVFTAATHFQLQSSFCFFPFDGTGLVHANNVSRALNIDYFNPNSWFQYKLSATLKTTAPLSIGTYAQRVAYTYYVVDRANQMRLLMPARFGFRYPKIAVLAGNTTDTVHRYPATVNQDNTLSVQYNNAIMVPGDGLISVQSARPPSGIPHKFVYTQETHMTLLNDFAAVRAAIDIIA